MDRVGLAVLGDTTVEQSGNAGMLEVGEDLALAQEALQRRVELQTRADDLERDLLLELTIAAFGQEHFAHAASPELTPRCGSCRSDSCQWAV